MHPFYFVRFVWEHLVWWAEWLKGSGGDVVGSITTGLIVALGVVAFAKREDLKPLYGRIKSRPILTTVLVMPFAALVLLCLTKYASFIGATLTTVGLLLALDNNRKNHDREEKRFERQSLAAQAALALELSTIADYCKAVITELSKIKVGEFARVINKDVASLTFPSTPPTVAGTFKEMITSTRDIHVSDRCATILSFLQLVRANIIRFRESDTLYTQKTIEQEKLRVVMLYGLASTMFDLSRRWHRSVRDFDWDRVEMIVTALDLDQDIEFSIFVASSIELYPHNPLSLFHFDANIERRYIDGNPDSEVDDAENDIYMALPVSSRTSRQ